MEKAQVNHILQERARNSSIVLFVMRETSRSVAFMENSIHYLYNSFRERRQLESFGTAASSVESFDVFLFFK